MTICFLASLVNQTFTVPLDASAKFAFDGIADQVIRNPSRHDPDAGEYNQSDDRFLGHTAGEFAQDGAAKADQSHGKCAQRNGIAS
jgi:hypothetical protein